MLYEVITLLLFLLLNFQLVKLSAVERGATLLLRHMALLFIPVAVGLIAYLEPFTQSLGVIMLNVLETHCTLAAPDMVPWLPWPDQSMTFVSYNFV